MCVCVGGGGGGGERPLHVHKHTTYYTRRFGLSKIESSAFSGINLTLMNVKELPIYRCVQGGTYT